MFMGINILLKCIPTPDSSLVKNGINCFKFITDFTSKKYQLLIHTWSSYSYKVLV